MGRPGKASTEGSNRSATARTPSGGPKAAAIAFPGRNDGPADIRVGMARAGSVMASPARPRTVPRRAILAVLFGMVWPGGVQRFSKISIRGLPITPPSVIAMRNPGSATNALA